MGLFNSILNSVTNSVTNKIGDEVKKGIGNKIQETVNDLNRVDDDINIKIEELKQAIRDGKEEEFVGSLSVEDKKAIIIRLTKKQVGNAFTNPSSTKEAEYDLKCIEALSKGEDNNTNN